jgi:hypothetical protein
MRLGALSAVFLVGVLALAASFLYLSSQILNEQRKAEVISMVDTAMSQISAQYARAEAGEITDGTGTRTSDWISSATSATARSNTSSSMISMA